MIKKIMLIFMIVMMALSICVNAEEVAVVDETSVEETEVRENLALGKNATATAEQKGNVASNLTDDDIVSYWATNKVNSSVEVDLGDVFYIDTIDFIPEANRNYGYKLSVSIDGINYISIIEGSNSEELSVVTENFIPVEAKNVMLTITSLPADVDWINIKELRVYGENHGTTLYYDDEGQGLSIDISETEIIGTFTGESRTAWGRKMTLVVAVFDENKMVAYNTATSIIPTYGTEFTKDISLSIEELGVDIEGKTAEVFVWDDFENMQTLVPPMTVTVGAAE